MEASVSNDDSTAPARRGGQTYAHGDDSWIVPTLVQAFASDPVANHLFPDPAARAIGMAHAFRMALRSGSKIGAIDLIRPDHAAAIWLRPEHPKPGLSRMLLAGALATPFIVGWNATRRMLRYERFVEDCRFRLMAGRPHWYLFAIGIQPSCQRRGFGSTLLGMGCRRARENHLPCYLETSNERNLAFYEKSGFVIVADHRLPGSNLTVWSLTTENAVSPG